MRTPVDLRRTAAMVILVLIAFVTGSVAPAAAGSAAASSPPWTGQRSGPMSQVQGDPAGTGAEDDALANIAVCLQESRQLAVALLIDESRSLRQTDPEGRRVDAAENALAGIAELARSAGEEAVAEVMIAAFEDSYEVELPFTRLDDEHAEEFDLAFDRFRAEPGGLGTDMVQALIEAREALAAHAAEMGAGDGVQPCSVIILFTDGVYDLLPRSEEPGLPATKSYLPGSSLQTRDDIAAALERGRDVMCADDGVADRIRSEDIAIIGVMLAGSESKGRFLRSLTTGSAAEGEEQTCGRIPGNGTFLAAADGDALIGRFDEVATRFGGGSIVIAEPELPLCARGGCGPDGTVSFEVDDLNRAVRILALAPRPGLEVDIVSPSGEGTVVEPGAVEVGTASGSATDVAGRGYAIVLDRPDGEDGWAGRWTVSVTDTADDAGTALVQVYTFSDLEVSLGVEDLRRGGTATFEARIIVPGAEEEPTEFASVSGVVRLEDPITGVVRTTPLEGPPEGPLTAEFDVPEDLRASSLRATAVATAVTEQGVAISARSKTTDLTVFRPEGSIQFGPAVLNFPTLEGEGTTTATLVVVGGDEPGCVSFEEATLTGPEAAGAIAIGYDGRATVSRSDCIVIGAGETREILISLSPESRSSGAVRGHVVVHEMVGGSEGTHTDIPVVASFDRGVDEAKRLVLAGLLMLVGLLLPMGLLYAINTYQARFQSLDAVRGAELPVRVRGNQVFLVGDDVERRFVLRTRDFVSLEDRGSSRSFAFGGVRFRAKASRNPFGGTMALAEPEAGAEKLKGGVGRKVELDTGLAGSWIFLLDPDRTRRGDRNVAEGTVLAFIAADAGDAGVDALKEDIQGRVPDTASDLATAVWSKTVKRSATASDRSVAEHDTEGGSAP